MKKHFYQLIAFTLFYFGISFFKACCTFRDVPPYFEYGALELYFEENVFDSEPFVLYITPTEIEFLSNAYTNFGNELYACTLDMPGHVGQKSPNISIEVSSNQSFKPSAGIDTLLNSIIFYNEIALDQQTSIPQFYKEDDTWEFMLMEQPDSLNHPFQLKIKIQKENGTTVEATTSEIIWK